jgi:short-chain Z-isoprenyl diphosphate synthase
MHEVREELGRRDPSRPGGAGVRSVLPVINARLKNLLYAWYERRLAAALEGQALPRHVGLVMDGNRRWARQRGLSNPSVGHRYGAEHVDHVLRWCRELGIANVTIYVASIDNLRKRGDAEVQYLLEVVESVVLARLGQPGSEWRVRIAGQLDVLPASTANALKLAVEQTRDCATGASVTIAIGYDGRQEIVEALRSLLDAAARHGTSLTELAARIDDSAIAAHLYTAGQPDLDLIIRTSGEQRLSGFLLWQSARSDLYFCDVFWPAFRKVDFLRALRAYSRRHTDRCPR